MWTVKIVPTSKGQYLNELVWCLSMFDINLSSVSCIVLYNHNVPSWHPVQPFLPLSHSNHINRLLIINCFLNYKITLKGSLIHLITSNSIFNPTKTIIFTIDVFWVSKGFEMKMYNIHLYVSIHTHTYILKLIVCSNKLQQDYIIGKYLNIVNSKVNSDKYKLVMITSLSIKLPGNLNDEEHGIE